MLFDVYSEDYIYRVKEEYKNAGGEQIKVIELTPVNKDMDFFKIDLSVNQSKNAIVSSKIYERSGMRYTYEINTFTPNVALNDSFFVFQVDEYDGIQVTDTRF
jgi:outer membrane lipoprotein-sorting protein